MKKKNNKSLILFILSVVLVLSITMVIKYKNSLDSNKEGIDNKENSGNKDKEIDSDKNNKENDNPFSKLSYYKKELLDRYESYYKEHHSFSIEQVVTYVNIGLDKEFYSEYKDANMNKGILVLMNKYNKLRDDYEPDDLEEIDSKYFIYGNTLVRKLRKEAKEAFESLSKASIENGTPVYGQSAYRPYEMQSDLYESAVYEYGKERADIDTARPGFSEHQTGLAIDVSSTKGGNMLYFDDTASFTWMKDNAYKYGFILRYRDDKTDITGFMYESWHYRYVGLEVAKDMHDNYPDLTYDEYYVRFLNEK